MTDNYIELLSLIRKSRLVEGFGTRVETSLMLMLLSSLIDGKNEGSSNVTVSQKSLLTLFEKYKLDLKIKDVELICSAINLKHSARPELKEELLENLTTGLSGYFQQENSISHKKFNLGLISLIFLIIASYFVANRIMHPPVSKITYFSNRNLEGTPFAEEYGPLPKAVDFGMNSPKKGMPSDNFSIRYESDFNVGKDSVISLSVTSDDGMRVYIDDDLIMDYWIPQDNVEHSKSIPIAAGKHRLKIEYFEALVGAKLSFNMTSSMPNNLLFESPE